MPDTLFSMHCQRSLPFYINNAELILSDHNAVNTRSPGFALLSLALGGFGLGTGEFVIMGLLPDVAHSLNITEPQAGNAIASYALGVVVGAPIIAVLTARMNRKILLIALMFIFFIGNLATALAGNYPTLVAARFIAGLPHGAYFGIASLVAASLVPADKRGKAISLVMLGLTVATLAGVPLAAWLGQFFSWHIAFAFVGAIGLSTCLMITMLVPATANRSDAHPMKELTALKNSQVLMTLLTGAVGFGGMFAIFTYIIPTLKNLAALQDNLVPWVMAAFGLGMIVGNLVGGRLADHNPLKVIGGALVWNTLIMVLFPFLAGHVFTGLLATFLVGTSSVLLPSIQIRLMDVAKEAQTLAAAMNHSALNIANAMGAYLGGVAITMGFGWISTAYVGIALGISGILVYLLTASHASRLILSADNQS